MSSRPSYRGPIKTVEHAFMASTVLNIRCQRCHGSRSEWAYLLCLRRPRAKELALRQAIGGFHCHGCKHSVKVFNSARKQGEL